MVESGSYGSSDSSSDRPLKKLKESVDGEEKQEELVDELAEKKLMSPQHQPEDQAVDYDDSHVSESGSGSDSTSNGGSFSVEDKDMAAQPGSLEWHLRELERKEEMVNQQRLCYPGSDSDFDEKDDYLVEGADKVDLDVWFKYLQDIEDSDGFDIEHFPGVSEMTFLVPLTRLEESGPQYATAKNLSEVAINDFNQKNKTHYVVDKVLKANVGGGRFQDYLITFQAMNNDPCKPPEEPDVKIFQARVHDKVDDEDINVILCRPKVFATSV